MLIKPSNCIKGTINVPGDKSISHRAVMFGAISEGRTQIKGYLKSDDLMSTISCFKTMGVTIYDKENTLCVEGKGLFGLEKPSGILYTGNSGTTTRLMMGILAGQHFETIVDGDESIRKRPMDRAAVPLKRMGAHIELKNAKYAPFKIRPSQLNGIEYVMPVASAQVKSAVIFASLYANGNTKITEKQKTRDHTEIMLKQFGGDIEIKHDDILIKPVKELKGRVVHVPGDISSAAFFIVAASILPGSDITIKNVGLNPTRTGVIDALKMMGADIEVIYANGENSEPSGDIKVKYRELKGTEISGSLIPRMIDEIPVLMVAACVSRGVTVIKDAEELKVKESDRLDSMEKNLKKLGADIHTTDDGMIIKGRGSQFKFSSSSVESFNDHRIAMAMSVAGLKSENFVDIQNYDCINISYPDFYTTLRSLIK